MLPCGRFQSHMGKLKSILSKSFIYLSVSWWLPHRHFIMSSHVFFFFLASINMPNRNWNMSHELCSRSTRFRNWMNKQWNPITLPHLREIQPEKVSCFVYHHHMHELGNFHLDRAREVYSGFCNTKNFCNTAFLIMSTALQILKLAFLNVSFGILPEAKRNNEAIYCYRYLTKL